MASSALHRGVPATSGLVGEHDREGGPSVRAQRSRDGMRERSGSGDAAGTGPGLVRRPSRSATVPMPAPAGMSGGAAAQGNPRSRSPYASTSTSISSINSLADTSVSSQTSYTTAGTTASRRPTTPPLYQVPPPHTSFHAYLLTWTQPQVHAFLALNRCAEHAPAFDAHHITGANGVILELGADELKEMGVTRVGDRVRLLGGIRELRRRCVAPSQHLAVGWNVGRTGAGTGWGTVPLAGSSGTRRPTTASTVDVDFGTGSAGGIEFRLNGSAPGQTGGYRNDQPQTAISPSMGPLVHTAPSVDPNASLDRSRQGGPMRRLNASRPPPLQLEQTSLAAAPSPSPVAPGTASSTDTDGGGGMSVRRGGGSVGTSITLPRGMATMPMALPAGAAVSPAESSGSAGSNQAQAPIASPHPPGEGGAGERAGSSVSSGSNYSNDTIRGSLGSSNQTAPLGGLGMTAASGAQVRGYATRPSPPVTTPDARSAGTHTARRSPSPALIDPGNFMDRPLPPPPPSEAPSAWPPASSTDPRIALAHRKTNSTTMGRPLAISPTKSKFAGRTGGGGSIAHPYASASVRNQIYAQSQKSASPTKDAFARDADGSPASDYTQGDLLTPTYSESGQRFGGAAGPRAGSIDIHASPSLSTNDARRRTVKFVNAEDGTSRVINLENCQHGIDVLEKALRKFGKWRGGAGDVGMSSESEGESEDSVGLEVDGWSVFVERGSEDSSDTPLTDAELMDICLASPDDPRRSYALSLRRSRQLGNRKNMEGFFGEVPPMPLSPKSPPYFAGPRLGSASNSPSKGSNLKHLNRASTVSIMSGLGVPMPGQSPSKADAPPSNTMSKSPSTTTSFLANRGKKMYNFFGHRPPSELIASHLADYFPSAKRKQLEKTARNSMIRLSMIGGEGVNADGADLNRLQSRFSVASSIGASSSRTSRSASSMKNVTILEHGEAVPLPRVSISTDGSRSSTDQARARVSKQPPLLPPLLPDGESLSDQLKVYSPKVGRPPSIAMSNRRGSGGSSRSRMSTLSQFRRARRKSDAASMLTVDEITAEVERRRASVITFADSDHEDGIEAESTEDEQDQFLAPRYSKRITSGSLPALPQADSGDGTDEGDYEEEMESEEEESSEEEEEEEQEEEGEENMKYTSTGSKRSIKWMKGALLGAGSFGQVFLGLDAQSGVLMAVKQVELGEGGGHGEERRKGMIVALEREIELLKNLEHEHIVQYLDSSVDAQHLNIFLEYVPGGTVSSILNKWGPFEEALVQRWIKQTLTGLEYLHERDIIHRDIKGANILVDNKGGIKIADFGISKKVENSLLSTRVKSSVAGRNGRQSLQGSVFWMAPEVVKQTSYTKKADIWSVGCLVVEMLTGQRPWPDLTQMQALFRIGSSAKPSIPGDISADAVNILEQTFEIDHHKRPHASDLLRHPFIVKQG